jgi:hypothetical protein
VHPDTPSENGVEPGLTERQLLDDLDRSRKNCEDEILAGSSDHSEDLEAMVE